MFDLAKKKFPLPGESGWLLGGHIPTAKSRKEADEARKYMEQLREETGMRLVDKVFDGPGPPNKFWIAFSKRKFMNIVHR
jgi:actin related protein 2/3 complex subunit 3